MKGRQLDAFVYYLKFVLKLTAAGAFICIIGGLSLRASIAIVILPAFVGIWNWQKASNEFTLYEVKIVPRIGLMMMALGLVTEEEWKRLNQKRLAPALTWKNSWTSLHLQNGITTVVLSDHPRELSDKMLVHWTSHDAKTGRDFCLPFSQRDSIEYSQELDFLKLKDSEYPKDNCFDWSPEFFFEQGMDGSKVGGYEMGIEVASSWWNNNKERLENEGIAKSLKVHDKPETRRTRIAFVILPRDVFLLFNARDWDKEFAKDLRERVEKELVLARWRIETIGFTDNIQHEFMSMCKLGESYIGDFADVTVKSLVC
jgi:hypothetical protein